jgi:predicted molibdopterin-dependent oxidoreductase YjgC
MTHRTERIGRWLRLTKTLRITVNGEPREVAQGSSVSSALLEAGTPIRASVTGSPRSAFCSMGACMECLVQVDGHKMRGCLTFCTEGMEVVTDV